MKFTKQQKIQGALSIAVVLTAVWLFNGSVVLRVLAQEATGTPSRGAANAASAASPKTALVAVAQEQKPEAAERVASAYSPGIEDILKMARAHVSKEVIMAFIKHSTTAYQPTSSEIIALKEQGVADEVITALLERGAEAKARVNRFKGAVAAPAIVRDLSTPGNLDPESYEFWFYHYAYPRALSYSYRTLPSYYPNYRSGLSRPFPAVSRFSDFRHPGWR